MVNNRQSARQRAYEHLRQGIMTLALAPGRRLDEVSLTREIGVSRTPVREALQQLAADGLVVQAPNGRYQIAEMDLFRVRELFEAHVVVVKAVSHLLAARADHAAVERIAEAARAVDEAIATGDSNAIAEANSALHLIETEVAGNSYLFALGKRVYPHLQRLAFVSFGGSAAVRADDNLEAHFRQVHADHWEYVEAISAGDGAWAEVVGLRHAELFHSRVRAFISANATSALDVRALSGGGAGGR